MAEKKLMSEEEQAALEAEMTAAGITVVTPKPGTATIALLKKRESR